MRVLMSQPTKLNVYEFEVSQGHHGGVLKTFSKNVIKDMQLYTQSNGDLKSKWNQLKFCMIQVAFLSTDHYILRQDLHCL